MLSSYPGNGLSQASAPAAPHTPGLDAAWPRGLPGTAEREAMFSELRRRFGPAVVGYVWAFRRIHPGLLLTLSFVLSQIANEVLIYEVFEAYDARNTMRTVVEIVSPLTLWLVVDTVLQFALTLCGLGHRILVQMADGDLMVLHRRLFSARPAQLERTVKGTLAIAPHSLRFAIDRLDTAAGRFYVWARWRDMRLLLTPGAL